MPYGRTYEDYQTYMAQNPDALVSQMDSVVIHKGGQVILTILLTSCDLQLMFLRKRNTAASVAEIFRDLRKRLGEPYFSMLFQVIVTDRGSEFTDPMKIEADPETGKSSAGYFTAIP